MKGKYGKLRKMLADCDISTRPGMVMIETHERYSLADLLQEISEEGMAEDNKRD